MSDNKYYDLKTSLGIMQSLPNTENVELLNRFLSLLCYLEDGDGIDSPLATITKLKSDIIHIDSKTDFNISGDLFTLFASKLKRQIGRAHV